MGFVLEARSLYKNYKEDSGELVVLRDVSLSVNRGEIVVIVGPSGSGKSTLLYILGGLLRPTSGEVFIDGENLFDHRDRELAVIRNKKIGFIFQFHHLLPEFTALENVAMPLWIRGENRIERAKEILELVSVAHRKGHLPSQLSGGERQRVAVARALANDPSIVLADEPSGNLDRELSSSLHNLIKRIAIETKRTFVIVTHKESMKEIAGRVFKLTDGRLEPER
ncbi:lipoprotein-releasing system ATP-binding protein LolD [candidate division WOR-3 bacterium JGI_Cruoil_03_44_89]|uniref:Lipoprotein-releasing system ATP-binding protein LolD n=1 Tax=candidate division WOR-3 bacterium JGI_Cruoil_03_44_89 TaxID=1973748 RepID=A0A235BTK6_UNCW3|nr:MAG: lipoprotein-releasing system ATP-binding protein LolD [candidate division WOR-3 bacterium JGI_Cruoil_03_44_89]